MNNEEKILVILETLVTKVDNLEAGQAKLEDSQAKLEVRLSDVNSRLNRIDGRLNHIESGQVEIKETLGAVFEQTIDLTEFKTSITKSLTKAAP